MSDAFIFDAYAALCDLRRSAVSQLSPQRSHQSPTAPAKGKPAEDGPSSCFDGKSNASSTQADHLASIEPHMSQLSPTRAAPRYLTETEFCHFEERAAIKEFDAGLPRAEAERQALDDVLNARNAAKK